MIKCGRCASSCLLTASHTHAHTPLLPPMTLVSPAPSNSSNTLAPSALASPSDPGSSTDASLRGLYSRAARAFLQRDIPLARLRTVR